MNSNPLKPVPPQPEPQSELAMAKINALQAVVAFLEGAEAAATKDARAFEWSPADEVQKAIEELLLLRAENARLTGELAETVVHLKAGYEIQSNYETKTESLRQQLASVERERDEAKDGIRRLEHAVKRSDELYLEYECGRNELATLRAELATVQQAQRDTSARAGMAEELAGALSNHGAIAYASKHLAWLQDIYRNAKEAGEPNPYPGADEKTIADIRAMESALIKFAALPKGRL